MCVYKIYVYNIYDTGNPFYLCLLDFIISLYNSVFYVQYYSFIIAMYILTFYSYSFYIEFYFAFLFW